MTIFKRFSISIFLNFSLLLFAQNIKTTTNLERLHSMPHTVLRAFKVSYPEKIDSISYDFMFSDWYIEVSNKKLYWAGGRLLPLDELENKENWRPIIDYLYPTKIPNPESFTKKQIEKLKVESSSAVRKKSSVHHPAFYDALYDGLTRRKIESKIIRFDYLGLRVSVHRDIVEALKNVEKDLIEQAKTNKNVKDFITTISSIDGYNWREIADSPSRSNHSWGIAVDILPKNWGNKNIYWNWISTWNKNWMLIPLDRRWMPPNEVVKAFEKQGFIWGGKWYLWDTMHFEYRPELLVLQSWGFYD